MTRTTSTRMLTVAAVSMFLLWPWDVIADDSHIRPEVAKNERWRRVDSLEPRFRLTFSADGARLAADVPGVGIRVWNAKTGKESATLHLEKKMPGYIAFHPKISKLAYLPLFGEKAVRLWDLEADRNWTIMPHSGRCTSVAFSPDGDSFVTAGEDDRAASLKGWDLNTLKVKWTLAIADTSAGQLAFSLDGRLLAYAADTNPRLALAAARKPYDVVLVDVEKREEIRRFKAAMSPLGIWFSADGKRLITGDRPQTIRIWDVATSKCLETVPFIGSELLLDLDYSSSANLLAGRYGAKPSSIVLWRPGEAGDFERVLELKDFPGQMALSPDGKLLAWSGEKDFGVWELAPAKGLPLKPDPASLPGQEFVRPLKARQLWQKQAEEKARFVAAAFDPRSNRLAIADEKATISLREARGGDEEKKMSVGNWIRELVFHGGGARLASVGEVLKVWVPETGEEIWQVAPRFDQGTLLASSPDGKLLATGTAYQPAQKLKPLESPSIRRDYKRMTIGEILLLEWSGGRLVRKVYSEGGYVRQLAFSGNGRWLAGWTAPPLLPSVLAKSRKLPDSQIHIWEVATGRKSHEMNMPLGSMENTPFLWVSDNGKRLLTGDRQQAFELWDVETGKSLQRMAKLENTHLTGFAITPDGRRLAAAYAEVFNRVVIWDPMEGRKLLTLEEPEPITHLAFSGDGKLLAYGNEKRLKAVELTAAGP